MSETCSDRGVSEVLGYVLIFGMVLAAISIVSLSGFATLEDARDAEQRNNAARAFDVLANNLEDVYERGAPSRATELSLGGSQLYTDEAVDLRVDVDGSQVVDSSIRPLVFRGDGGAEFVYEGGAVFQTQRQGGYVLRDPPIQVDGDQFLFTVVETNSTNVQSVGGPAVLVRSVARERDVAARLGGGGNHDVTIELDGSPRQELWRYHLETELEMDCSAAGDTLTCVDDGIDPDTVLITVTEIGVELDT